MGNILLLRTAAKQGARPVIALSQLLTSKVPVARSSKLHHSVIVASGRLLVGDDRLAGDPLVTGSQSRVACKRRQELDRAIRSRRLSILQRAAVYVHMYVLSLALPAIALLTY